MNSILVIAPHPDDETLGCGGTILKYRAEGVKVYWLICTQFYRHGKTPENIQQRKQEIDQVNRMYDFTQCFELGYDAASLTYADLGGMVGKITSIMKEVRPEVILLPNRSDVHTDHYIVFKAAYSSTKHFNFPFIRKIMMYETVSETEFAPALAENYFSPNVFVDVSPFHERKLEIMKVYHSELMQPFYPRNLSTLQALGRYRGSAIGKEYAEAFMLLKEII